MKLYSKLDPKEILRGILLVVISIVFCSTLGYADGWSESPMGANPQTVEWVITKDNGSTILKFKNIQRYYSFTNRSGILASLLMAKSSGLPVRIYSTSAPTGEGTNGLPDLGNANQSTLWVQFGYLSDRNFSDSNS